MFIRSLLFSLLLATAVRPTTVRGQETTPDESQVIEWLRSDDRSDRIRGANALGNVDYDELGDELRAALIEALEAEGRLAAARRRGEVGQLRGPEFIAQLALKVTYLRDPRSIPGLVGALGTSPPAIDALAAFGASSVGAILALLRSDDDGSVAMDG